MLFFPNHLSNLLACSVCFGSDGTTLAAANAAVIFMLGILVVVLGSFLSFIFYLARRAKMAAVDEELGSATLENSEKP